MSPVIRGLIRDPGGSPIPGARAFFVSGPEPFPDIAALSDDDGRFTLSAHSPGTYAVRCAAEGFASEAVTLELPDQGEHRLEITLRPDTSRSPQ